MDWKFMRLGRTSRGVGSYGVWRATSNSLDRFLGLTEETPQRVAML